MTNDCGTKLEIRAKRKKGNKKAHEKVTSEGSKSTPQDTRVLRSWGGGAVREMLCQLLSTSKSDLKLMSRKIGKRKTQHKMKQPNTAQIIPN